MPKGLTPVQCAEALGCSKDQVLALIASGELSAFNVGLGKQRARFRVEETELESFKKRRAAKPLPAPRKRRQIPATAREWV